MTVRIPVISSTLLNLVYSGLPSFEAEKIQEYAEAGANHIDVYEDMLINGVSYKSYHASTKAYQKYKEANTEIRELIIALKDAVAISVDNAKGAEKKRILNQVIAYYKYFNNAVKDAETQIREENKGNASILGRIQNSIEQSIQQFTASNK